MISKVVVLVMVVSFVGCEWMRELRDPVRGCSRLLGDPPSIVSRAGEHHGSDGESTSSHPTREKEAR